TNSAANIDYKTDGTAPTASATTANIAIIESENFDDVTFGNWTTVSVTGDQEWVIVENYGVNGTPCAKMTGYDGQPYANEDWLISPALNLDNYTGEVLNFQNAMNYSGNPLELKVSTNYSGSGDPNSADWTRQTILRVLKLQQTFRILILHGQMLRGINYLMLILFLQVQVLLCLHLRTELLL
ncbi:MAG: hypothetical protein B6D61_13650, partial [Bacteroidetes bacterium 4484_249]